MVRSAGGPARFHKASKCVSLPARQLLSAKRATNTTVCPSSRALILGTDTRRRRRTGRWWRHWSFPHPPVFREERDARRQRNNEKRRRHEDQRVSSGRCSVCFPQDVCIFPPALLLPSTGQQSLLPLWLSCGRTTPGYDVSTLHCLHVPLRSNASKVRYNLDFIQNYLT